MELSPVAIRAINEFRESVRKDVGLIQNRADLVSEVMLVFLRGTTKPSRRYSGTQHIAWIDLHPNELRPAGRI
jgi:hypothetical protein